ncbi:hypothetical protein NMY22_g18588 [Coprinellus aureogranulatus]|nr:hypothetical protein NMY22_g18588 [Coprinellus aureogranulatus]
MPNFSALPTEILIQILFHLDPQELSALAQCGRMLHDLVYEFGWLQYLLSNPRPLRIQPRRVSKALVDKVKFTARPLSRTWRAKEQATLAISPSRLIVAAGTFLHSYSFHHASGKPSMRWEGSVNLNETHVRGRNIVSIAFIGDGGLDNTLLVAYQEHLVERITLVAPTPDGETPLSFTRTPLPVFPKGDYIESFSTCSGHLLSLSSNGVARLAHQSILFNGEDNIPKSFWISSIDLAERSWKSHLSLTPSTPFAALGSTSKTPLTIHNILPDSGLSTLPSVIPHTEKSTDPDNLSSSAVYGITQAPLSSPWGSSPQILASGWFDGRARIYDLRCASHSPKPSCTNPKFTSTGTPLLTPVLVMADRWSTEPVYALSSGGGSGAHLAAGTARHSVVSFWDVRAPRDGWSVHAPGNDRSPVFDVHLESSRLFGVTDLRGFVYDFGPDMTADCYPSIRASPPSMNRENLKHKAGILSYRVTKYRHNGSGLGDDFS